MTYRVSPKAFEVPLMNAVKWAREKHKVDIDRIIDDVLKQEFNIDIEYDDSKYFPVVKYILFESEKHFTMFLLKWT